MSTLEATRRVLEPIGVSPVGLEPIDADAVALIVEVGGGRAVLEWRPLGDDSTPAFARGPASAASYRRRPGAWDVDAEATPSDVREAVLEACRRLATLPLDVDPEALRSAGPTGAPIDVEALVAALAVDVEAALESGALANPEGWSVDFVRSFQRWRQVAEVGLVRPDRSLVFIVAPRDDAQPVYARTARLDLVYYSDDLPKDRHDELHARDAATIDRFAAWLAAWDRRRG